MLGAWALFDPEPMSVTAKTIEDTRVLTIGRDDFYDLLSDNTEITASIFAMLVKTVPPTGRALGWYSKESLRALSMSDPAAVETRTA